MASVVSDSRDASYVRYAMLVDKFGRRKRRKPVYELQTFYGQLQHIYLLKLPPSCSRDLKVDSNGTEDTTVILAGIRSYKLDEGENVTLADAGLDFQFYTTTGGFDVVDITSVQALVGRVQSLENTRQWVIIDRSGTLARAVFADDDDQSND
ncbi:hypothetical protein DXG03_009246 [Asterophora parasitica]|uniref:Uncharacterized protein n=1 Tax=Asterophora parasitica TaxID=117018 RepID=A0A9P7G6G2_9AGAR|nr:hypothetical protein DXG03_009246 [Asterophora parasitica]